MATALILGANGFVGPWLAGELSAHGYRVCASDVQAGPSPRLACDSYMAADLLDPASLVRLLGETSPDQVYDLAAVSSVGQSWRMPALTMRVNVEGTVNLLEACRAMETSPKVLLVGSSEEYAPSDRPLSEDSPLAANNPYGISKEAQERLAAMYADRYGMRIYRVRAFNHTGPGQSDRFVIPGWCRQVAEIERSGRPGTMRVGNLDVARDISDVRDIVRGYRMLVESDYAGEVFNLGCEKAHPLSELLEEIVSHSNHSIQVETDPALLRPADNPIIRSDTSKFFNLLGFAPAQDGVLHAIDDIMGFYLEDAG